METDDRIWVSVRREIDGSIALFGCVPFLKEDSPSVSPCTECIQPRLCFLESYLCLRSSASIILQYRFESTNLIGGQGRSDGAANGRGRRRDIWSL